MSFHHEPPINELREFGISQFLAGVEMELTDVEHAAFHDRRWNKYHDKTDKIAYKGLVRKMSPEERLNLRALLDNGESVSKIDAEIEERRKRFLGR